MTTYFIILKFFKSSDIKILATPAMFNVHLLWWTVADKSEPMFHVQLDGITPKWYSAINHGKKYFSLTPFKIFSE